MGMSGHTPGPWFCNGLEVSASYTDNDGNRFQMHVASVTNRGIGRAPTMEEHANARLISTSPELRECLEQALKDLRLAHAEICGLQGLDPAKHDWPEWSSPANTIRWAERILAKAEGRS